MHRLIKFNQEQNNDITYTMQAKDFTINI